MIYADGKQPDPVTPEESSDDILDDVNWRDEDDDEGVQDGAQSAGNPRLLGDVIPCEYSLTNWSHLVSHSLTYWSHDDDVELGGFTWTNSLINPLGNHPSVEIVAIWASSQMASDEEHGIAIVPARVVQSIVQSLSSVLQMMTTKKHCSATISNLSRQLTWSQPSE